MNVEALFLPEILLVEPKVFEDSRGFFFESYNQLQFEKETSLSPVFIQENHSHSKRSVLRGLHYQLPPKAQDKLVRAVQGKVFDIAVDVRKKSPTFGKWVGEILSDKNKKQLWIPQGFAHGFFVLSETAEVAYKTTAFYNPKYECCINWNDSDLNIDWPLIEKPIISKKDTNGLEIKLADLF